MDLLNDVTEELQKEGEDPSRFYFCFLSVTRITSHVDGTNLQFLFS